MAVKFHILLLNGPNINMLGTREPEKYGSLTLAEIVNHLTSEAAALNVSLDHLQSNAEYAFIEIHLSNVHAREPFRQHSYLSDIAAGVICGLGADGYSYALQTAVKRLSQSH